MKNDSSDGNVRDCLQKYSSNYEILDLAEAKRQEIIKSDKFLLDTKNYKHHPGSFYTSRLLNELIQQVESLNFSSTEICSKSYHISDKMDTD